MGREFDNSSFHNFASKNGLTFRFSCPQTSSQNGKSERMIQRLNDITLVLLNHASIPPQYWVEALHAATYIHNILPTTTLNYHTPTSVLYLKHPSYHHLRTFGCCCYPNTAATRPHKLAPRSKQCVFLGYPPNQRGYRCLDLTTGKTIVSRHVIFDETLFPFASQQQNHSYTFLDSPSDVPNPLLYDYIQQPTQIPSSMMMMMRIQIRNEGRQNALAEILEVLTEVCETYKLPLAQTWIPCRHRSVLAAYGGGFKQSCSSFDGSCMGRVCMSTTDVAFYVVDAHLWGFRELESMFELSN